MCQQKGLLVPPGYYLASPLLRSQISGHVSCDLIREKACGNGKLETKCPLVKLALTDKKKFTISSETSISYCVVFGNNDVIRMITFTYFYHIHFTLVPQGIESISLTFIKQMFFHSISSKQTKGM